MITVLFSVLLLAVETPSTTPEAANTPALEAPAADATKTAEKEKKVCRIDPANTGTRMKKKLCLTQNEWDMRARGKNAGDLKTLGAR